MPTLIRCNRQLRMLATYVVVIVLAVLVPTVAFAATPVPSGSISPFVWDPIDEKWENGNPSGHAEGQTAAIAVKLAKLTVGTAYTVDLCLQVTEAPFTGAHGFTSFEAWNTTYTPAIFPNGPAVDLAHPAWDMDDAAIWGYNINITGVTAAAMDHGRCNINYLGLTVLFTVTDATNAYLVYGGHLAAPGDLLPAGTPGGNASVPNNGGASHMTGVFQTRIAASENNTSGAGDKTINFKPDEIAAKPGLFLSKTVSASAACPGQDEVTVPANTTLYYCFTVANTGLAPLLNVVLTDNLLPDSNLTDNLQGLTDADNDGVLDDLAAGTSATAGPIAYTIADTSVTNTASATGTDVGTVTADSTAVVYILDLLVEKTAAVAGVPETGGDVTFTIDVTNQTPAPVLLNALADNLYGDLAMTTVEPHTWSTSSCVLPQTLAAAGEVGATYRCSFTASVAGDAQAGSVTEHSNTVTATICDETYTASCATGTGSETVDITDVAAVPLTIVKRATGATTLPEPGGVFSYEVVVTNGSAVDTATVSDLDDTYLANLQENGSCVDGDGNTVAPWTLAPSESLRCTFTVSHTGQPGQFTNRVTVTAIDDDGADVGGESNTVTVNITDVAAVPLTIVKRATSGTELPEPGGVFSYEVVVTNGSTVDTATVSDLDDTYLANLQENGSCVDGGGNTVAPWTLAPSESLRCTFTVSHTGQPGQFTNTITVTAIDDDGTDVGGDSNEVTVTVTDVAAVPLTIVKSATSGTELPEPGGAFSYEVVVTNGSTVDTATVSDLDDTYLANLQENGSCVDGAGNTVAPWTLAPSESLHCTFTVSHTGQPGQFTNTVTVTAIDDDGADVGGDSNEVTVTVTDVLAVPLTIVKQATGTTTLPEPGGVFSYEVVVTNGSAVDTATVSDLDDTYLANLQENGSCVDDGGNTVAPWTLAPSESLHCTFTVSHTGQPGQFTNTVTVTAIDDDGADVGGDSNEVTVTVTDVLAVPLTIVKQATGTTTLPEPGGAFSYEVVVTNGSAVDTATVSDLDDTYLADLHENGSCVDDGGNTVAPWTLAPSESLRCTFTVNHTRQPGQFTNTVTVTAIDDDGADVGGDSNEVTVTVTDVPAVPLTIVKRATGATTLPELGGAFNYEVVVTNGSAVDTATVSDLDDTYLANLQENGSCVDDAGNTVAPWTLAPSESLRCTFTVSHMGQPGQFTNTVTVTAVDDDGADVGGESNAVTVNITDVAAVPLTIVKQATSGTELPEPGGAFNYEVVVTNESTVDTATVSDLDDTYLADLQENGSCVDGGGNTVAPWTLAPSESLRCTFTVSHTGQPGQFTNTVTVTAVDDDGADVSNESNEVTVVVTDLLPDITVTKSADETEVLAAGQEVLFTFLVVNNSTEAALLDSLNDDRFGDLNGQGSCALPVNLAPVNQDSSTYRCTVTKVLSSGDLADHVNTVTATALDDEGNSDIETASATVTFAYWGFTPGFWKNHSPARPSGGNDAWSGYVAYQYDQPLSTVFAMPQCVAIKNSATLLDALSFRGKRGVTGAAETLLRAAVSSLLNASFHETWDNSPVHPAADASIDPLVNPETGGLYFPYSSATIIALVNDAMASCDRTTMLTLAEEFDGHNNSIHFAPWGIQLAALRYADEDSTELPVIVLLPIVMR